MNSIVSSSLFSTISNLSFHSLSIFRIFILGFSLIKACLLEIVGSDLLHVGLPSCYNKSVKTPFKNSHEPNSPFNTSSGFVTLKMCILKSNGKGILLNIGLIWLPGFSCKFWEGKLNLFLKGVFKYLSSYWDSLHSLISVEF